MRWHPPVPRRVTDPAGKEWLVGRAWPDLLAGTYVLEVRAPDRPGVLGGFFREGRFDPVAAVDDYRLPALARESTKGETVVHRAHKRAVIRGADTYIKVFRAGHAPAAAARHMLATAHLAGSPLRTPVLTAAGQDVLGFSSLAGRSYHELGQDPAITDAFFASLWDEWSRAWTDTVLRSNSSEFRGILEQLPLLDADKELAKLRPWIDHWLVHSEGIREAAPGRAALLTQADAVTAGLRARPHDRLGWAHGDLHDKQILGTDNAGGPGLLDFDQAGRAEAALDLANLDVHLELRRRQKRLTARRFAIAHASIVSAAMHLHVSPERFEAYAASARLRLACLYSFRPPWNSGAVRYLTSTAPVLPELHRSPEHRETEDEPVPTLSTENGA